MWINQKTNTFRYNEEGAEARREKHEKEPSPPQAHKDINDTIGAEIKKYREYSLGVENENLEKLLKKENRDTTVQRQMTRNYYTRNTIFKITVKNMKKKIKKTLRKLKKKDNRDILADASLVS